MSIITFTLRLRHMQEHQLKVQAPMELTQAPDSPPLDHFSPVLPAGARQGVPTTDKAPAGALPSTAG